MVILVDIDNTIESLLVAWFDSLNNTYGTNVKPSDATDWDFSELFPELSKEQIHSEIKKDGFWKTVKPIDGAAEYLKKLIDDGHTVFLCSATDWIDIRPKYEDLLQKYFPFIDWSHIVICYDKKLLKADFLVDDGVHNLLDGEYKKILFSQPHNLNYNAEENGMTRADNWKDVYRIISDSQ